MKKTLAVIFIIFLILATACTRQDNGGALKEETQEHIAIAAKAPEILPSLGGISLGDNKEKAEKLLGNDYTQTYHREAGHYPESFYIWDYETGFTIIIGATSKKVLQITATSPEGITNLGVKAGDSAKLTLNTYRAKYIEPESIHGGKLLGIFKIENGQAVIFDFNIADGLVNPVEEISPDEKVERIILTYPEYLDDSF